MCACLFPSAVRFLRLLAETQGYSKFVARLVVDAADDFFCERDVRLARQLPGLQDDAAVTGVFARRNGSGQTMENCISCAAESKSLSALSIYPSHQQLREPVSTSSRT